MQVANAAGCAKEHSTCYIAETTMGSRKGNKMTKKAKKPRQFWIVDGAHVYSNGKDALEDARQWGNEEIIHVQEVLDGEAPAPESDLSDDGGQPEFAELHYMSG